MLDRKEIDIEIARLEYGESSYPAYAKLANLYTIRNQMDHTEIPQQKSSPYMMGYSEAPSPESLDLYGDSDFLRSISGKDPYKAWPVMDELMDTLQIVNRRVYDSVMRKLQNIDSV